MSILCILTFCLIAFAFGIGVGFSYKDKLQLDSVKSLSHCCAARHIILNVKNGICYYKCTGCDKECRAIYWQKR